MNESASDRFEQAFFRAWRALRHPEDPELSPHEQEVLAHIPAEGGIALRDLVQHLSLPQSTMSVLIKDFEQRGFVRRRRDLVDERRLAIMLTAKGRAKVSRPGLDRAKLAKALDSLGSAARRTLIEALEQVVEKAEIARGPAPHVIGRDEQGADRRGRKTRGSRGNPVL